MIPKEALPQEGWFAQYFYSRYPVAYDQGQMLIFRLSTTDNKAWRHKR
jgi:hypothetical protein